MYFTGEEKVSWFPRRQVEFSWWIFRECQGGLKRTLRLWLQHLSSCTCKNTSGMTMMSFKMQLRSKFRKQWHQEGGTRGSRQASLSAAGQQRPTETGRRVVTWLAHWMTSLQTIWDGEGRGLDRADTTAGLCSNMDTRVTPAPVKWRHLVLQMRSAILHSFTRRVHRIHEDCHNLFLVNLVSAQYYMAHGVVF